MRLKLKSSFVICLMVLSAIFAATNFGFIATGPTDERYENGSQLGLDRQQNYHWGPATPISEPLLKQNWSVKMSRDPEIDVEGNMVYVVWEDNNSVNGAGLDYDIFLRSYDGNSWSDIEVISEPKAGTNSNTAWSFDPDIAVWNGNIYVVWEDLNDTNGASTDFDVFYRTKPAGSGWEDIQVISEPVYGLDQNDLDSYDPRIAVEDGNIYVVWEDLTNYDSSGADSDIFYRCNLTGNNWEAIQVISEPIAGQDNTDASSSAGLAVENNNIYVVWDDVTDFDSSGADWDIHYRCNLTGNNWESIQVISEPVFGQDNNDNAFDPEIVVENNDIYTAWEDNTDYNSAGGDKDIFYRCNLTGNSWEAIQVISEPLPNDDNNQVTSDDVAIEVEDSNIYLTWHDQNDTDNAASDDDIFLKINHTGTDWETVQIISEPSPGNNKNTGDSDDPDIAVLNNKIHMVWEDTNNTEGAGPDDDIHYRGTFIAPALNSPSVTPVIGNTSTIFNFTVTYLDADDDAPTQLTVKINSNNYPMMESNAGDTSYWNGKTYYYKTKLNIGNDHTYNFQASDGVYPVSTPILNLPDVNNTAPNLTTPDIHTAIEDELYEVDYDYDDIDEENVGQVLTWDLDSDASWLELNTTTGVLSGTPTNDDVGQYSVNVTINDTIDMDYTDFNLTVQNVNDPPTIITIDNGTATSGEMYSMEYEAADIDPTNDVLTWALNTDASDWLGLENGNWANGTPTFSDVGDYWVNITVNDGNGGSDFHNFSLSVAGGISPNQDPIIWPRGLIMAFINVTYYIDYNATDDRTDPSDLIWGWGTNANWLSFNLTTAILKGVPDESDIGTYWVNITVNDDEGGTDFLNYSIEVKTIPNQKPDITTTDVTTAEVGMEYSVIYQATDDSTAAVNLTWSMETNADWLSFNTTTGELAGTPTESDAGPYWVNITVRDDEDGITIHNFTIIMLEPSNRPPTLNITTTDGKKYKMGDKVVIEGTSVDPDGDEVRIKVKFRFPNGTATDFWYITDEADIPSLPDEAKKLVWHYISINADGTWKYTFDTKVWNDIAKYLGDPLIKGVYSLSFKAMDSYFGGEESEVANITFELSAKSGGSVTGFDLGDLMLYLIIIIIIIIIVVVVIVLALRRRKPAAPAPRPYPAGEEDEEMGEYDDEYDEEYEDEDEWDREEGEEEEWAGEEDEIEYEEEPEEEAWDEEAEEEEEEEWAAEEESEEEEWEAEDEAEFPELELYDCPKCGEEIEIPYSDDGKVALECESCGAKGMIPNPYLED